MNKVVVDVLNGELKYTALLSTASKTQYFCAPTFSTMTALSLSLSAAVNIS